MSTDFHTSSSILLPSRFVSLRQQPLRNLFAYLHRRLPVDIDAIELAQIHDFGEEQEEQLSKVVLIQALQ